MENYLVNPVNPMVTLRHPAFTQRSWRRGQDGRFGTLKGKVAKKKIQTKKHKASKAKQPTSKAVVVYKEKNPMSPLMLLNKRRHKAGRHVRRAKAKVLVINPRRRVSHKARRHAMMSYRNPLPGFLKGPGNLVMLGVAIVAGTTIGPIIVEKLSAQLTVLQKPMVRIAAYVTLSTVAYMGLKRVKQIPPQVAQVLAAALLVPAVMEAKDMIMSKIGGATAPTAVSYADSELSAYVPQQVGAYVPQGLSADGNYGSSY